MSLKASLLWLAAASIGASAPSLTVPKGPIKVTSQRADIDDQGRLMLYRGAVRLTKGNLELRGERLELRQPADGQFEARLTGSPARLRQAAQGDAPPLTASADTIVYDTQAAVLSLSGGATLARGGDTLSGDSIRYDLASRRISASGADGEQIQFVIQPPERQAPVDEAPVEQALPPASEASPRTETPPASPAPAPTR